MTLSCAALLAASGSLAHAAVSRHPVAAARAGKAAAAPKRGSAGTGPHTIAHGERAGHGSPVGVSSVSAASGRHAGRADAVAETRGSSRDHGRQGGKKAQQDEARADRAGRHGMLTKQQTARERHGAHGRSEPEEPVQVPMMHRVHGRLVPYPGTQDGGGKLQARVDEAPLRHATVSQPGSRGISHAAVADEPEPGPADGGTGPLPHHDRKIHLAPTPVAPVSTPTSTGRRKASTQDFLTASAAAPAVALPLPQPPVARVPAPVVRVQAPAQLPAQAASRSVVMVQPAALPVLSAPQQASLPTVALGPEMPEPLLVPHELVRETAIATDPVIFDERGHLLMPAALKGSHDILVHQNTMADADGLERIQDDDDLERMRRSGGIVGFPEMAGLRVDERLPMNRRYCRPWTAQFVATLARAHYARFGTSLQINSAVRTVEFQRRLMRTNGNAAPFEGETASPHLTGQAVDLAKKGLSMTEIAWMRAYLLPLVEAGKIDVEEEFQQACFHISVYKKYAPAVPQRRTIYAARHGADTALADALAVER